MKKTIGLLCAIGLTVIGFSQVAGAAPSAELEKAVKDSISMSKSEANHKLLEAAKDGDLKELKVAIASGADINFANDKGSTALMIACIQDHYNIVDYLINGVKVNGSHVKPSVNVKNKNGLTALMGVASLTGNLNIVELLVKDGKANVNLKNARDYSAVALALQNKKFAVVKYLIEEGGADVDTAGPFGNTLLMMAVMDKDERTIKYLVEERKVDVNIANNVDENALSLAKTFYPKIVKYLKSKGARLPY